MYRAAIIFLALLASLTFNLVSSWTFCYSCETTDPLVQCSGKVELCSSERSLTDDNSTIESQNSIILSALLVNSTMNYFSNTTDQGTLFEDGVCYTIQGVPRFNGKWKEKRGCSRRDISCEQLTEQLELRNAKCEKCSSIMCNEPQYKPKPDQHDSEKESETKKWYQSPWFYVTMIILILISAIFIIFYTIPESRASIDDCLRRKRFDLANDPGVNTEAMIEAAKAWSHIGRRHRDRHRY